MFEWIMLGFTCVTGIVFLMVILHFTRRRGEDCSRYPYDCPYCCHAMECIEIISEKNRRQENDKKKR